MDRTLLFNKLEKAGIGARFLAILKDMYAGVECCIKLNGHISISFHSNRGLKQGDALSPKLFNCFTSEAIQIFREENYSP